jgi:hypothetical protein
MKERQCRHEPVCNALAMDRAQFCEAHIGEAHRCTRTRTIEGKEQRCKKWARPGLVVCEKHGGRFPSSVAQMERAKGLTAMQRFVRPREGQVSYADAFDEEFRRTLGRIEWLNEAIAGLGDSDVDEEGDGEDYSALIWGKTKQEEIGAGEEPGTNVTYEARVHILEDMLRWERKHLLDIEKIAIGAGLEQQRLDMLKTYAARTATIMANALEALGLDIHDPKVLAALQAARGVDLPDHDIIDVEAIEG